MKKIIAQNPLFFAFLTPGIVDFIMTIVGQISQKTDLNLINEASPAFYFLQKSYFIFIIGSILWFILWYWLFKYLRQPFNLILMFLFVCGHAWGSSSWFVKIFRENGMFDINNQFLTIFSWFLIIGYLTIISIIATYCLQIYIDQRIKLPQHN